MTDERDRFADADRLLASIATDEGDNLEALRPYGTTEDIERVIHALGDEAIGAAIGTLGDGKEFFAAAFLCGVAAAHQEGREWAEWLLTNHRIMPLLNLGNLRAAARRIAAGGHR